MTYSYGMNNGVYGPQLKGLNNINNMKNNKNKNNDEDEEKGPIFKLLKLPNELN